jgi:hypothetical protein
MKLLLTLDRSNGDAKVRNFIEWSIFGVVNQVDSFPPPRPARIWSAFRLRRRRSLRTASLNFDQDGRECRLFAVERRIPTVNSGASFSSAECCKSHSI